MGWQDIYFSFFYLFHKMGFIKGKEAHSKQDLP